jgi:PAS domain-containing protein
MGYMSENKWIARPTVSVALRYGLALVSVAAALGLAQLFRFFHLPQPFTSVALSAVAITFWYGGTKPGILAALLSAVVRAYLFEAEVSIASRIVYGLVFLIFGVLMARVTRMRNELEVRVAERTSQLTSINEELRRSQTYLAKAQRLSLTGSFGWRVSTGELIWSEETFRIYQYDRTMKPTMELILHRVHPEDAALVKRTIERVSRDGKDFDFEHRLLMPDGSVKYVHVVSHAAGDEAGGLGHVGTVMDVTAAKEAEDKIRVIIETVPAFIWTARPDGWVEFISQGWLDYTGMTLEQGLGWGWE